MRVWLLLGRVGLSGMRAPSPSVLERPSGGNAPLVGLMQLRQSFKAGSFHLKLKGDAQGPGASGGGGLPPATLRRSVLSCNTRAQVTLPTHIPNILPT